MVKNMTIAQLRRENKKLRTQAAKASQLRTLREENFGLKHQRQAAFFKKVGNVKRQVGSYMMKRVSQPRKVIVRKVYVQRPIVQQPQQNPDMFGWNVVDDLL